MAYGARPSRAESGQAGQAGQAEREPAIRPIRSIRRSRMNRINSPSCARYRRSIEQQCSTLAVDNRRPADSARDDTTADSSLYGPRDGRGTRRHPDDPADSGLDVPEGPGHDRQQYARRPRR